MSFSNISFKYCKAQPEPKEEIKAAALTVNRPVVERTVNLKCQNNEEIDFDVMQPTFCSTTPTFHLKNKISKYL